MNLIPFLLLLTSCSYLTKHEGKQTDASLPLDGLREKYNAVYQEVESELDPATGWISHIDCDSLLWNGLACSLGFPVNIELAEYEPGLMGRRPREPHGQCFTEENGDVGSKSSMSRDSATGYLSCLWGRKDLLAMQRFATRSENNDWFIGIPKDRFFETNLYFNLAGLLGRMIYVASSGADDRYYRRTGYLYPPVEKDFERNIQTQGILLQDGVDAAYNLTTAINKEMLDRLKENAAAYPDDFLFSAALGRFTGDQSRALDLLLSDTLVCPSYARGERPDVYCKIIWIQAAKIVLDHLDD